MSRAPGFTVYSEGRARSVAAHQMPAWKLLIGRGDKQTTSYANGEATGWALLVPPGLTNTATAHGSYVALFIDPGHAIGEDGRRVLNLGQRRATALLAQLDSGHATGLPDALGDILHIDNSPVGQAIRALASTDDIDNFSAALGVSEQHARRLTRAHTGCTFTQIQRWNRITQAIQLMAATTVADAAARAGFADQPHFTRTSVQMLGRTPGSMRNAAVR